MSLYVAWLTWHIYISNKNMEYLESPNGKIRIWNFDLLEIAWHQLQTSVVVLVQLSRVMLWTKIQLATSDLKIPNRIYRNVLFLLLRLKCPTTSRVSIIIFWVFNTSVCIWQFVIGITQNLPTIRHLFLRFKHHNCITDKIVKTGMWPRCRTNCVVPPGLSIIAHYVNTLAI